MTTDTEALREQFEAWARKNELEAERHKYADDQYDDRAATRAWWAWRDAFQAGHAAAKAETAAAVAQEMERCIDIIESYRIPVGNSAAGEMACEWTYGALKTIRDAIRAGAKEPSDADQA